MEKNIILTALNEIGAEIGYPFYVFEDGSYSKSFVNGKMNYAMVVKKKFTAPGIGEKAARDILSTAESASSPRVPAGRRKLTPQEEDSLKQAEFSMLSHTYPGKQGLELVCEFGSPELLQKHLFTDGSFNRTTRKPGAHCSREPTFPNWKILSKKSGRAELSCNIVPNFAAGRQ